MLQEIHRSECGILFNDHVLRDLGIPTDCVPPSSTKLGPATPDVQSTIPTSAAAPASQDPACTSAPPRPSIQRAGFSSFLRTLKFKVNTALTQGGDHVKETLPDQASKRLDDLDKTDVLEPMHDQLVANPLWWLLQTPTWYPGEFWWVPLPMHSSSLDLLNTRRFAPTLVSACSVLTTGYYRPDFSGRRRFPTDEDQRAYQRVHPSVLFRMESDAPHVAPYRPKARLPPNWKENMSAE